MDINDLYFGVLVKDFNSKEMKQYNLFDLSMIRWSAARYKTMPKKQKQELTNPLHFVFGDVWSRCEYEMIISNFPFSSPEELYATGQKIDLYTLYVEPNAKLLMDMVNKITIKSARRYLKEWNERYKGYM